MPACSRADSWYPSDLERAVVGFQRATVTLVRFPGILPARVAAAAIDVSDACPWNQSPRLPHDLPERMRPPQDLRDELVERMRVLLNALAGELLQENEAVQAVLEVLGLADERGPGPRLDSRRSTAPAHRRGIAQERRLERREPDHSRPHCGGVSGQRGQGPPASWTRLTASGRGSRQSALRRGNFPRRAGAGPGRQAVRSRHSTGHRRGCKRRRSGPTPRQRLARSETSCCTVPLRSSAAAPSDSLACHRRGGHSARRFLPLRQSMCSETLTAFPEPGPSCWHASRLTKLPGLTPASPDGGGPRTPTASRPRREPCW